MTFEQFLRNIHADNYHGTDDDMSDSFDKWLTDLQADDFIKYGELYAMEFLKECLPLYNESFNSGWNDCVDQILYNANKNNISFM